MQNYPLVRQYIIDCFNGGNFQIKFENEFYCFYKMTMYFPKSSAFRKMSINLKCVFDSDRNMFRLYRSHPKLKIEDSIHIHSWWSPKSVALNWVFALDDPFLFQLQDLMIFQLVGENKKHAAEQTEDDKKIMRKFK